MSRGTHRGSGTAAALALAACTTGSSQRVPVDYPRSYAHQEDEADREGHLLIWSAIDRGKASKLVADFGTLHPHIRVSYIEMPARDLNRRFLAAAAAGHGTADLLWSSAMDLQIKLVNDGYSERYVSPERAHLPKWANWKDQAWGTTAEPIVMVYNRDLIAEATVPRSHVALTLLLEQMPIPPVDRIATSDPDASAVGYLYLSQDQQATHDIWRLARAMGANRVHLFTRAEDVLHDIEAGHAAIGYNIVGSYALREIETHPRLGMVLPRDYTLLMSRIAVIPAAARHPNAARLFLDFLLSQRGQAHLAAEDIPSVRADVRNPAALRPPGVPLRAIRVGPALLVSQDQLTRQLFEKRWRGAMRITAGRRPFAAPTTAGRSGNAAAAHP